MREGKKKSQKTKKTRRHSLHASFHAFKPSYNIFGAIEPAPEPSQSALTAVPMGAKKRGRQRLHAGFQLLKPMRTTSSASDYPLVRLPKGSDRSAKERAHQKSSLFPARSARTPDPAIGTPILQTHSPLNQNCDGETSRKKREKKMLSTPTWTRRNFQI